MTSMWAQRGDHISVKAEVGCVLPFTRHLKPGKCSLTLDVELCKGMLVSKRGWVMAINSRWVRGFCPQTRAPVSECALWVQTRD